MALGARAAILSALLLAICLGAWHIATLPKAASAVVKIREIMRRKPSARTAASETT